MPDPVVLTVGAARLEISEEQYEHLRTMLAGEFWDMSSAIDYGQATALAHACLHAPGLLARLVEADEIHVSRDRVAAIDGITREARALLGGTGA